MDFDDDETMLLWRGVEKYIWSMSQMGMGNGDPRKIPFLNLRARMRPTVARIQAEREAARL